MLLITAWLFFKITQIKVIQNTSVYWYCPPKVSFKIGQLATKYEKLFGEKCRSKNRVMSIAASPGKCKSSAQGPKRTFSILKHLASHWISHFAARKDLVLYEEGPARGAGGTSVNASLRLSGLRRRTLIPSSTRVELPCCCTICRKVRSRLKFTKQFWPRLQVYPRLQT